MARFPKPSLTADAVVLRPRGAAYQVLLIRRRYEPFAGCWALPGGFVQPGETTRQAAARELEEETGVRAEPFLEIGIADRPGRDPRGWTVSGVWAFVVPSRAAAAGGDDASEARWFGLDGLPPLAFDHAEVLSRARSRIAELVRAPGGWQRLLPGSARRGPAARARVLRVFGPHRVRIPVVRKRY